MLNNIIAILIGYFLGSFLPAYFLCRWIKHVDIRTIGTFNAGTTNLKRSVGVLPAIPTAIYDTSKGILAMFIAQYGLKTSLLVAYLSGLAATLGHIFPFYLGFRGGQGAATLTGILLFNLYKIFVVGKTFLVIWDLIVILLVIVIVWFISRTQELLSITVLPLFMYFLIIRTPLNLILITTLIIVGYLLYLGIKNIIRFQLLKIDTGKNPDLRLWRKLLRPAAMIFPFLSFFLAKPTLITLIGVVLALFFFLDFSRILSKRVNQFFLKDISTGFKMFKEKESLRMSSMTLFLMACFLCFLLFEQKIAFTAVTFLIFGDLSAVILGLVYGKTKLFNKTLEGTLAHFMACIVLGYIIHLYLPISLLTILVGSLTATFIEVLPIAVDDNLSVPIVAGAIMTISSRLY